jgi:hypothetical protein
VSRAFRVLIGFAGVLLLGCALAVLGYAIVTHEGVSDLGWVVVIMFFVLGLLLLRRSTSWNRPRYCPRCGAVAPRGLAVCPRCGLDFEAPVWAAIGKFKLP